MCGIIGYNGKEKVIPILIDGLKSLEYRGYDSAGIAYFKNNNIEMTKEVGRIKELEKIIKDEAAYIGIGHTRWATHGKPNKTNAHPHKVGTVTLVHNGIIENYESLKEELQKKGYHFLSDTDTEVAAGMLDDTLKSSKDMIEALSTVQSIFTGSYAFGILLDQEPDTLYAMKKDSPLIIGVKEDGYFIASDIPAILNYTKDYILLDDFDIVKIKDQQLTIYHDGKEIKHEVQTFAYDEETAQKDGYPHYMLKEIHEEPRVLEKTIKPFLENGTTSLLKNLPDISTYRHIDIVACGSAWHAGMIGKSLIEKYGKLPVQCHIASEYRYQPLFLDEKCLVIFISQSGETADTLASLKIAKEHGAHTLAIVNVASSSIARAADEVILTQAGCEIAVATTKAFDAQVAILSLLAFRTAIDKNEIDSKEIEQILEDYERLIKLTEKLIEQKDYEQIADHIYEKEDIFYLGRQIDYALSLEGSLKLKEISYIHCDAYAAGELKHGTISLVEQDTPVITIVTDEKIASKTISNMKEVRARGSYNILITTEMLDFKSDVYQDKIVLPTVHPMVMPMLTVIPLQLLAYYVALKRGCDIDKPRNLAKSVTVE